MARSTVLICGLLVLFLSAVNARAQGTLTNGWTHTGTVSPIGDSDTWTFSAAVGDRIVVRVGEITQTGAFNPRVRLQNPGAVLIASASGAVAAEVSVTATNAGTFTLIVDDAAGTTATGTYRVTLAKSPGAVFVAPGDEGGALVNGAVQTGTIDVGDLDVWTLNASAGDTIVVRMGELTNASSLTPVLFLYGPNGALLSAYGSSAVAAEVSFRATNSGTFTVVAGDNSGGLSGSGTYRLTMGKTGDAIVVSPNDEGGALTNGVMYTGTIEVGELDVWSFTANSGDSIVLRTGELTNGSPLTPAIWLYGPDGALLDAYGSSSVASEVSFRATNSGTFTVMVADFTSFYTGSGNYRLTLAKTGDAIGVSPGDEGGPLSNGLTYTGMVDVGDMDVWSFTANSGDSIVLRMGELTNGSALTPALWLYGPNGALLAAYGSSAVASEVSVRATNSGTFVVIAADFTSFYTGSGTYRVTLAKTGSASAVSPGDEGGSLTNGVTHTGVIDLGDLDLWTFSANAGESITLRMGETVDGSSLTPYLRLFGPNGALLEFYGSSSVAAEVTVRATNSGTFTVIATDLSSFYTGSGGYRLTLAKTGEPIVITPGDEGGVLTNGITYTGTIDSGDVDFWSLSAMAGDSIVLRMGEIVSGSSLTPAIWLYGPDGALLAAYGSSSAASEVTVRATNSGTFTVVAADFSSFFAGSGAYRLTLAQTRVPILLSPGDEGGSLNGSVSYDGNLELGDLDIFHFTACGGDILTLKVDELVGGSTLSPWIRLFGRDGVLIRSVTGAATIQTTVQTTNGGLFTVVVSDLSSFYAGSGTYRFTASGLTDGLKLCIPVIFGTNVNLRGIGGGSNAVYRIYTTTNIATPGSQWLPIVTNQFDGFGTFAITNLFSPGERYFRLLQP